MARPPMSHCLTLPIYAFKADLNRVVTYVTCAESAWQPATKPSSPLFVHFLFKVKH